MPPAAGVAPSVLDEWGQGRVATTVRVAGEREGFLAGMGIMAVGVVLLPLMDASAKYLARVDGMAPGEVTFYRFFFQSLETVPLVLWAGGVAALRPRRLWLNLLRGMLLGVSSLFFFTAVKFMPLASSLAIFFVEPFILTLLSALVLREHVGWRRWLAVPVGFVGAILVIDPSFNRFGWVALLPLGTATCFATYMLLNRALGTRDTPLVMQYMSGVGGSIAVGAAVAVGGAVARVPDLAPSLPSGAGAWWLVLVIGTISTFAHLLLVKAFQMTPASILAPFQYLEIVSASLIGYLLFANFPCAGQLAGIVVIIGAGLYMLWLEH